MVAGDSGEKLLLSAGRALMRGGDFHGASVSFEHLISILSLTPRPRVLIQNATILVQDSAGTTRNGLRAISRIVFFGCHFKGNLHLTKCCLGGGLELVECEFNDDIALHACSIAEFFRIDKCVFHRDLHLRDVDLPLDVKFSRTSFQGASRIKTISSRVDAGTSKHAYDNELDQQLSRLLFQRCTFQRQLQVTADGEHKEISFDSSDIESSSMASIFVGDSVELSSFPDSRIDGRLSLEISASAEPKVAAGWEWTASWMGPPTGGRMAASFANSSIVGQLNIHLPHFVEIGFLRATVNPGSLTIPLSQLRLENETHFTGKDRTAVSRMPANNDRYRELSTQYQMLGTAFAGTITSQRHLDVCEWRARCFSLLFNSQSLGRPLCLLGHTWSFIALSIVVLFAMGLDPPWHHEYTVTFAMLTLVVVLLTSAIGAPFRLLTTFRRLAYVLCEGWINQRALAYGVCLRNVFGTIGAVIGLFAVIYGGASGFFQHNGEILDLCNRNVVTGQPGNDAALLAGCHVEPKSTFAAARILLYFSMTRFTNLNTDEYRPTKRLQYVTVIETLIGIALVTLVVALYGRRFLRL